MKRLGFVVVFAVLALLLFNVAISGFSLLTVKAGQSNVSNLDDWSMFRHDAQHTGSSISASSNSSLIWQFSTSDKIRSSAAVVEGVVYDSSNNGVVYALNASNGSVIWQYNSSSQVESSPAVVNGVVYIGSFDGKIYALGTATSQTTTPQPTATPSSTPLSTPTPAPTAAPTSAPTSQPTANPTSPTSNQALAQIFTTEPTTGPVLSVGSNINESTDWAILGVIIATAAIALLTLFLIYKKR
jgi:hypothetical protein